MRLCECLPAAAAVIPAFAAAFRFVWAAALHVHAACFAFRCSVCRFAGRFAVFRLLPVPDCFVIAAVQAGQLRDIRSAAFVPVWVQGFLWYQTFRFVCSFAVILSVLFAVYPRFYLFLLYQACRFVSRILRESVLI